MLPQSRVDNREGFRKTRGHKVLRPRLWDAAVDYKHFNRSVTRLAATSSANTCRSIYIYICCSRGIACRMNSAAWGARVVFTCRCSAAAPEAMKHSRELFVRSGVNVCLHNLKLSAPIDLSAHVDFFDRKNL